MRKEIRISGFGGQGIVLAGYLLGKALTLYEEMEVVMTQSYGPEARGGASSANIVVADRPIDYPFVQKADVLVALSQEAYSKFRDQTSPEAIIIHDDGLVAIESTDTSIGIPATRIAEELGRRIVANVVMLGAFVAHTELTSKEALIQSLQSTVKEKTLPMNLEAFEAGYAFACETEQKNG